MADATCPGIVSIPDLVGIGTRLNFYVTISLAAIIPRTRYTRSLLQHLHANAGFFGLALLITAIVKTIKEQLDLYHAIFVMHMLVFFSVLQLNDTVTSRYSHRLDMMRAFQCFGILFIFPSWALYVWIKGSGFGSQPRCNDLVKYVFFIISVRGTVNWLRILAIACFPLRILSSSIQIGKMLLSRRWPPEMEYYEEPEEPEGFVFNLISRLVSSLVAVYGIVTTELIVHRNRSHVRAGDDSWGFGQVIPVLSLLHTFNGLLSTLKEWHYYNRSRERAESEAL